MLRRLLVLAVAALAAAPAALADGQMPFAAQGSPGAVSPDGSLRYLALNAGANTVLAEVQTKDGTLQRDDPARLVRDPVGRVRGRRRGALP